MAKDLLNYSIIDMRGSEAVLLVLGSPSLIVALYPLVFTCWVRPSTLVRTAHRVSLYTSVYRHLQLYTGVICGKVSRGNRRVLGRVVIFTSDGKNGRSVCCFEPLRCRPSG